MASSLLTLLDDVVSVLDDVAVLTKVAAKKTGGVIGDDLALNANQLQGTAPDQELKVVWTVSLGALINKVILVPLALVISAFAPVLIPYLLIVGGLYLAYEGTEKVLEKTVFRNKHKEVKEVLSPKEKIKGAIRTDFILSAEIIILALGEVAGKPLMVQVMVLGVIGFLMTIFIYGMVAVIVKLDDLGLLMIKKNMLSLVGKGLVRSMPWIMRSLGIVGTWAMFLVGGGILVKEGAHLAHLDPSKIPYPLNVSEVAALLAGLVVWAVIHGVKKLRS